MKQRHVLSVMDLGADEFAERCRRAIELKSERTDKQTLRGRVVGIHFRKTSTRTRSAFMVGAGRLGATTIYYGPNDLQTNTGESIEDTARVLAGYLDVLVMRTSDSLEEMQTFAAHPMSVVNALGGEEHPTQAVTDLTTILEHFGRLDGIDMLYMGEGNRTAASLALAFGRIHGGRLTLATPPGYGLDPAILARARQLAVTHGAVVEEQHSTSSLPVGVDVVYTSRWQEMGITKPDPDWRRVFMPFRVSEKVMVQVSKPNGTVLMHDLPAVRGEDVDDAVLDGPQSIAWTQAQNKLFGAMSVLEWVGAGVH